MIEEDEITRTRKHREEFESRVTQLKELGAPQIIIDEEIIKLKEKKKQKKSVRIGLKTIRCEKKLLKIFLHGLITQNLVKVIRTDCYVAAECA